MPIIMDNPNVVTFNQAQQNINPVPNPQPIRTVYAHMTTKNKSFIEMHNFLKSIGIKNNKFFLSLIDADLENIDPFDPNLNSYYKQKVLRECLCNPFYFYRECVRIPSVTPLRFELHRANLAQLFCMSLNLNVFLEVPRQCYKTCSSCVFYLYQYLFGGINMKFAFLHKSAEGSRDNLATLKSLRDQLPSYLQMRERIMPDGKVDKGKDSVTMMINPFNNNNIKTFASATNKAKAASLLRGKSLQFIYFDEYGFIPHNATVYLNGIAAFNTVRNNAKLYGAPYGVLMTTTAGFLSTDEGREAYETKEAATEFDESWYDKSYDEIKALIDANTKSDFVYIRYSYKQLGKSEQWFQDLCKLMKNDWTSIRREVLNQWVQGVENSPFKESDLETIGTLVREPISVTYLLGKYRFETYAQADVKTYPALIGVDVATGYMQDSSTIVVVDSKTTKVLGLLNCNYISIPDLARCIEFIVKNWMPNAIINPERNGVGHGLIAMLKKMGLTKNLYYEIKDVVVEERIDGIHSAGKRKIRSKVYGTNQTKAKRNELIELLVERVENHKDKFMSPVLYKELTGLEIKRNGKIEHSASGNDDTLFGMLLALDIWYNGSNLYERYGIRKTTIRTDEYEVDDVLNFDDNTMDITSSFNKSDVEINEDIENSLSMVTANPSKPLNEFLEERTIREQQYFNNMIRNNVIAQKAYRDAYSIPDTTRIEDIVPDTSIDGSGNGYGNTVPDSVLMDFYNVDDNRIYDEYNEMMNRFNVTTVPENMANYLNDSEYRYEDHFNF